MERSVKIVGRRRKEIDEKKLALAFLLLAKSIQQENVGSQDQGEQEPEAA
jgi:hypothetical protein